MRVTSSNRLSFNNVDGFLKKIVVKYNYGSQRGVKFSKENTSGRVSSLRNPGKS